MLCTPIHHDAPTPGYPPRQLPEVGDLVEFLSDWITQKAPSNGPVVATEGRMIAVRHSDTLEVVVWPPGSVELRETYDGRRLWIVS